MFSSLVDTNKSPEGFLDWWNENPIVLGGDRYCESPGLAVYYIQHSNAKTFDIRVEPIQQDQFAFTQSFLERVLGKDPVSYCLKIKVMHENNVLAEAILHVDDQCRWAAGEGAWKTLRGNPRNWELVIDNV